MRERKRDAFVMKKAIASFDPKIFLAKVSEGTTISKYRKNQIVFSQGQVADAVFYIQEGKVKLTVVSEQGKEAVVAILGPGHFFGEGCLNGRLLRIKTARAIDECVVTRIDKATMIATLRTEPKFSELFMAYLLTRNGRIEEDLIDQLFNSSEKRLARLLLLLANFGKEGKSEPIVGSFSQETLAEMIGTTRSRVSFFMNRFRKLGFIQYNGKLEVNNSLLNVVLHDNPPNSAGCRSQKIDCGVYGFEQRVLSVAIKFKSVRSEKRGGRRKLGTRAMLHLVKKLEIRFPRRGTLDRR